ncbi:Hypothetical predicted protein, partial [Paramuricea clavata]
GLSLQDHSDVQIECFQNMLTLFLLARTVLVPYDYRIHGSILEKLELNSITP